jgi:hypothetical protein
MPSVMGFVPQNDVSVVLAAVSMSFLVSSAAVPGPAANAAPARIVADKTALVIV